MGCVATFLLCLGLLDDLGHDIRNTIRPKSRWSLLFWLLLVELFMDATNLTNERLIELRHDQLRTWNLTGDVVRLLPGIGKLLTHRLEVGINLQTNLFDQIRNMALYFSVLWLDVLLVCWGIVLDYFGESFLIALEFYQANYIFQAGEHLVMLFLLSKIAWKFFQGGWCHEYPLGGQMYGFEQVQAEETFALRCRPFWWWEARLLEIFHNNIIISVMI
jgi:hypothetical protein